MPKLITKRWAGCIATASNQTLARNISDHLNIFDEVHGSDGSVNLKGETKQPFLFKALVITDTNIWETLNADLYVWKHASKVITVNSAIQK